MRIELGPKALDRAVDAVAHPLGEAGTQHEKDGDETEENPLLGLRDRDGRHEQRRQRQPRDAEERSAPDEVGFVAVERKDAQVLVQRPRHEQQQQHRARHVLDVPTEIQKHRDCHLAHHPQNFDPAFPRPCSAPTLTNKARPRLGVAIGNQSGEGRDLPVLWDRAPRARRFVSKLRLQTRTAKTI
eukprot:3248386-Rhodomonas_salina.1